MLEYFILSVFPLGNFFILVLTRGENKATNTFLPSSFLEFKKKVFS